MTGSWVTHGTTLTLETTGARRPTAGRHTRARGSSQIEGPCAYRGTAFFFSRMKRKRPHPVREVNWSHEHRKRNANRHPSRGKMFSLSHKNIMGMKTPPVGQGAGQEGVTPWPPLVAGDAAESGTGGLRQQLRLLRSSRG